RPEALGEERAPERHLHLAAGREGAKQALGVALVRGCERERKAFEFGPALRAPSDIMTASPLILRQACMIFSAFAPGATPDGSGLSLKRMIMPISAPSASR